MHVNCLYTYVLRNKILLVGTVKNVVRTYNPVQTNQSHSCLAMGNHRTEKRRLTRLQKSINQEARILQLQLALDATGGSKRHGHKENSPGITSTTLISTECRPGITHAHRRYQTPAQ